MPGSQTELPTLRAAARVWGRIGLLSFGGPAGQIALMHRVLVEEQGWIGEARFLHALNYCMLLPGPEAQQLATYIGWLMHRTRGGLVAGLLFIVPGVLVMLGLSAIYAAFGAVPFVAALFFGVKAAVLTIVVDAVLRVGRRALKTPTLKTLALASFVAIFALRAPFPVIILAAGLIGWIGRGSAQFAAGGGHGSSARGEPREGIVDRLIAGGGLRHTRPSRTAALRAVAIWIPIWLGPLAVLAAGLGPHNTWAQLAGFFSTMGVVTFGGAYAVLAYVGQGAVSTFHWMSAGEMADGLGLAETTPGPLIMVLQFVGFLAAFRHGGLDPWLAGSLGALLTTWITFAPCFFWIFLGGPYVEALRGNKALSAALSAITAAVVGVILNLAVWFALHVLFRSVHATPLLFGVGPDLPDLRSLDWRAAVLAAGAAVAVFRFRVGLFRVLAGAAAGGLILIRFAA